MYATIDENTAAAEEAAGTHSRRQRIAALVGTGLLLLGVSAVSMKASQEAKSTASLRATSSKLESKKPGDYARDVSTCTSASRGPVLKGIDVVAYFDSEEGVKAVQGDEDISMSWGGYVWLFSSETNRAKFAANPRQFMPQYGGFCSYGISHESQWDSTNLGPNTNPDTWKIIDGKLYLFMYGLPKTEFMVGEIDSEIGNADERWNEWFGGDDDATVILNTGCMWYCDQASNDMDDDVFKLCESPDGHMHDIVTGNVNAKATSPSTKQ